MSLSTFTPEKQREINEYAKEMLTHGPYAHLKWNMAPVATEPSDPMYQTRVSEDPRRDYENYQRLAQSGEDMGNAFVGGVQGGMSNLFDAGYLVSDFVKNDNDLSNWFKDKAQSWSDDSAARQSQVSDNNFINRTLAGTGSSLPLMIPGALAAIATGGGGLVASLVGGGITGSMEALGNTGQIQRELINSGKDPELARQSAYKNFIPELILDTATNAITLPGNMARALSPTWRTLLADTLGNPVQEMGQGFLQNAAKASGGTWGGMGKGLFNELSNLENVKNMFVEEGLPAGASALLMGGAGYMGGNIKNSIADGRNVELSSLERYRQAMDLAEQRLAQAYPEHNVTMNGTQPSGMMEVGGQPTTPMLPFYLERFRYPQMGESSVNGKGIFTDQPNQQNTEVPGRIAPQPAEQNPVQSSDGLTGLAKPANETVMPKPENPVPGAMPTMEAPAVQGKAAETTATNNVVKVTEAIGQTAQAAPLQAGPKTFTDIQEEIGRAYANAAANGTGVSRVIGGPNAPVTQVTPVIPVTSEKVQQNRPFKRYNDDAATFKNALAWLFSRPNSKSQVRMRELRESLGWDAERFSKMVQQLSANREIQTYSDYLGKLSKEDVAGAYRTDSGKAKYDISFSDKAPQFVPADAVQQKQLAGHSVKIATPDGRSEIDAHYAVVPADSLVASNTPDLEENTAYPAELQPRDRGRKSSETQVQDILTHLRPEFLADSPDTSGGAPIISTDGVVESGNGRTIALQRGYRDGVRTMEGYRQHLIKNAAQFGLNPDEVAAIQNPVLVRVRDTAMTAQERINFTTASNRSAVASMSTTETARQDAATLTPDVLSLYDVNSAPSSQGQYKFYQAFLEHIPVSEQGGLLTEKGTISQKLIERVRNALFYAAYGDEQLTARLSEAVGDDNNVRNINAGLLQAASVYAPLRQGMSKGQYHAQFDIAEDVSSAVNKLSELRQEGTKVGDFIGQSHMFGLEMDDVSKAMLVYMDKNKRFPNRIRDMITQYAEMVQTLGAPDEMTMFGEDLPSKLQLLEAAMDKALENNGQGNQGTLFDMKREKSPHVGADPIASRFIATTEYSENIPLSKLLVTEAISNDKLQKARKNMKDALSGAIAKRKPLSVIERGDGSYAVLDGNNTLTALKKMGAKSVPVEIVEGPYHKGVTDIESLYAANREAQEEFNNLMKELHHRLGGEVMVRKGLKNPERVKEKAIKDYGGKYNRVVDMLAGSLIFNSKAEAQQAFTKLKSNNRIVRFKDKFSKPDSMGYRDFSLNIRLSNGVIVEIQLHDRNILEAKNDIGHLLYEFVREHEKESNFAEAIEDVTLASRIIYNNAVQGIRAQASADLYASISEILSGGLAKEGEVLKYSGSIDSKRLLALTQEAFAGNGFSESTAKGTPSGYVLKNSNINTTPSDNLNNSSVPHKKPSIKNQNKDFAFIGRRGAVMLDESDVTQGRYEIAVRRKNMNVAEQMKAKGEDAQAIWLATGWEEGADGKWRYEIPDGKWKMEAFQDPAIVQEKVAGSGYDGEFYYRQTKLGQILNAPELFNAYPELEKIDVCIQKLPGVTRGSFTPPNIICLSEQLFEVSNEDVVNRIKEIEETEEFKRYNDTFNELWGQYDKVSTDEFERIDKAIIQLDNDWYATPLGEEHRRLTTHSTTQHSQTPGPDAMATLIHEVQHAIQHIEGFEFGIDVNNANTAVADMENQSYKALADWANKYGVNGDDVAGFRDAIKELARTDTNEAHKEMWQEWLDAFYEELTPEGAAEAKALAAKYKKSLRLSALSPTSRYVHNSGETEARNAATRSAMSESERRSKAPSQTEDVPRDVQWQRKSFAYKGGTAYSAQQDYSIRKTDSANPVKNNADVKTSKATIYKIIEALRAIRPVRWGVKAPKNVAGYTNRETQVARARYKNDVPTALHEIAHIVDYKLHLRDKVSNSPLMQDIEYELVDFGMKTSPDEVSDAYLMGNSQAAEYLRKEGIAEYFTHYAMSPDLTEQFAPKYTKLFRETLESDPELKKLVNDVFQVVREYESLSSEDKLKAGIVKGDERSNKPKSLLQAVKDGFEKFRREFDDAARDLERIQNIVRDRARQKKPGMLQHGELKDQFAFYDMLRTMPGFMGKAKGDVQALLAPVLKLGTEKYDSVVAYLKAGRALDYWANDLEPGIGLGQEETAQWVQDFERDHADLVKVAHQIQGAYEQMVLRTMVASGIWSKAQYNEYKKTWPHYVPFMRVDEDGNIKMPGSMGKRVVNLNKQVKRTKGMGSADAFMAIEDPYEVMIENAMRYHKLAEKNRVGQALIASAKADPGLFADLIEHVEGGERGSDSFYVWEGGKKQYYAADKVILNALASMENVAHDNLIAKAASKTSEALKLGATRANPAFIVTNFVRDSMYTAMTSARWGIPFYNAFKGLSLQMSKDPQKAKLIAEALENGLAYSGLTELNMNSDPESVARAIKKAIGDDSFFTKLQKGWDKTFGKVGGLNEMIELAPKFAEYEWYVKRGYPKRYAARMAREVNLDFSRGGSTGKAVNRYVAFFNPAIQGVSKMARVAAANPAKFAAKAVLFSMLPSVISWALGHDDDEYKRLSRNIKDRYWVFKVGGTWVRIVKPDLVGLLGSAVERMLDNAVDHNPAAFRNLDTSLFEALFPSYMPTVLGPILEHWGNKSFFYGETLIPQSLEDLPPEMQYRKDTSSMAKFLGKSWGISPIVIDNYISGYTGGTGQYVSRIPDMFNSPNDEARRFGERPIISRFTVDPYRSSESIDRFYEVRDLTTKAKNGFRELGKQGEHRTVSKDVRAAKMFEKAAKKISDMNRTIAHIREASGVTPEAKRKQIDRLRVESNKLAERTLAQYDEMK